MSFKIKTIALLLSAVCIMSSCLNSEYDETTYDDTAVSSFTLGTLKAYLHTTSSKGTDSIYTASVTGSDYKVYIDQLKNEIYTVDSLPVGTDMKHVLITVNTKNSGIAVLKSITSDSISTFSSTDSLDFSVERELQVYSFSREYKRSYKVRLAAHKEYADSFRWTMCPVNSKIAAYDNVAASAFKGSVYVLGAKDAGAELIKTIDNNAHTWADVALPASLSAKATMTVADNKLIITDAETIYSSADGDTWTTKQAQGIVKVLGYGNGEMYALSTNGDIMVSTDGADTWKADDIDNAKTLLPTEECSVLTNTTKTNTDVQRVVLIGNRSADFASDATAMVWSKVIDASYTEQQPWVYQKFEEYNKKVLPCMNNLTVINYANGMLAMGGQGKNANTANAFGKMYFSKDNGLTWIEDSRFAFPSGFAAGNAAMTVDNDNFIWIVATATGQVWRGRLNELGWKQYQTSFP